MNKLINAGVVVLALSCPNQTLAFTAPELELAREFSESGTEAVAAPLTTPSEYADLLGSVEAGPQLTPESGTACSGGIQYDDGGFEDGYGWNSSVFIGTYGMRFQLPASTNRLDAICICWRSLGGSSHDFGLRIWAADGPNGAPGSLLSVLPAASAHGITSAGTFVRYEIPGGLNVGTNAVYVAPVWAPSLFPSRYLCADENGPGGQPAYAGIYSSISNPDIRPSGQIGIPGAFPDYRALGIRIEAAASSACIPGPTTACLLSGRFKVEVEWTDFSAVTRDAFVASAHTSDTALFYWTNPNNWELLIKAINACSFNQRYWIYFAAATNVGYRVTVTDTVAGGAPKVYTNPVGNLAQATNDISAFVCDQ